MNLETPEAGYGAISEWEDLYMRSGFIAAT